MNGNTGAVIAVESASDADGHGTDVIVDLGGGQTPPVELALPPGVDARPLPGDAAALVDATSDGSKRAVAFFDPRTEPKAGDGEHRVYGRDSQGNTVCEIWCKSNGEIQITNFKAQAVTLHSVGPIVIKSDADDVRIDGGGQPFARVGDLISGTIKAKATAVGAPLIPAPEAPLGVPFAGRIISGRRGFTG